MKHASIASSLIAGLTLTVQAAVIEKSLDIQPVWAGTSVGFCLLTSGKIQYVAFYDADKQLTVASRHLDAEDWQFKKLDEHVAWDSHNYVVMAIDDDGQLHLSGNMHVKPLVYFRTQTPGDISTLERHEKMVGDRETRCTYPQFLRGPGNEVLFTYRDGRSGSGDQIYNVYDHKTKAWRRLLDQPLTDGHGKMNAYFHGPVKGSDGYMHLCWVWRNTPDASTNHDLSYARSKDMLHWEKGDGTPLKLPITIETAEIVDPIPVKGGITNGQATIGFDSQKRAIISYQKFDKDGMTQAYNARLEDGKWKIYQTSDGWDFRNLLQGGGSLGPEAGPRVGVHTVRLIDGKLLQSYDHPTKGSGTWVLDEKMLKPIGTVSEPRPEYMKELFKRTVDFPGMQVHFFNDLGKSEEPGVSYFLRWETLPAFRDQPREGAIPPANMLKLYKVKSQ